MLRRSLALIFLAGLLRVPARATIVWNAPVEVAPETAVISRAGPTVAGRKPFFNIFTGQYRYSRYRPDNKGNISRASKPERLYNENNVSFRTVKAWDDFIWTNQTALRYSDDPQVAPTKNHEWQMLSLVSSLAYKNKWDATFGNVLPNFHRYAITTSIEGLQSNVRWNFGEHKIELSTAGGRSSRGLDNAQYTRWVTGTSLAWSSPDKWLAFMDHLSAKLVNSTAHDDRSSIDRVGAPAAIDARNYAVRLEGRIFPNLLWNADWGVSDGRRNVASTLLPIKDHAVSGDIEWRPIVARREAWRRAIPSSIRGDFERIGEDYFAPVGSAGADQKRWSVRSDHPFFDWMQFQWNLNRFQDNARQRRSNTNYTLAQNYVLNLKPFLAPGLDRYKSDSITETLGSDGRDDYRSILKKLELQNLQLSLNFRHTGRASTNSTTNTKTEDYSAGLSHRIGTWSLGGQYGWQKIDNDVAAANDRKTENWSLNVGRPIELKYLGVVLQTRAGYRHSYDHLLNGTSWTMNDNVDAGLSTTWRGITGGVDWSRASTRLSVAGRNSKRFTGRANLAWRPPKLSALNIQLSGDILDDVEQDATQNFINRNVRLDMTYDF